MENETTGTPVVVRGLTFVRSEDHPEHLSSVFEIADNTQREITCSPGKNDAFLAVVHVYGGAGGWTSFQAESGETEVEAIEKAMDRAEIGWRELLALVAARGSITG